METPIIIGTFEVKETEDWMIHFETASWYQRVRIAPGIYPVTAYRGSWGDLGHTLYVSAEGICVGSSFTDRLLWAHSTHIDEDVGKTLRASKGLPPYDVGGFLSDGRLKVTNPDIVAVEWTAESTGEVRTRLKRKPRETALA